LRQGRDRYRDALSLDVPAHLVTVTPFYLDRTEVTNRAYQTFVAAGLARAPWPADAPIERFAALAVVNVGADDAEAYCRWRTPGGRLPSEAEWEWAARGVDGRLYPWGDAFRPECVNGLGGVAGVIEPVGAHACGATASGIQDLSGNVWEW